MLQEAEMEDARFPNMVAVECQPEDEAKFNRWYNEVHIPMLLKFAGILGVTRYKLASGTEGQAKYLAIYEFRDKASFDEYQNSPELAAARQEMSHTWGAKGFGTKWRAQYKPIKTWRR